MRRHWLDWLLCSVVGIFGHSAAAASLKVGTRISLQALNYPNRLVLEEDLSLIVAPLDDGDPQAATFDVVSGLAGHGSVSLQSVLHPGFFWRGAADGIALQQNDNSSSFAGDASFFVRPGLASGADASLESFNYPGYFLRNQYLKCLLAPRSSNAQFLNSASFMVKTVAGPKSYNLVLQAPEVGGTLGVGAKACKPSDLTCTSSYPQGTQLRIAATPDSGFEFQVWTGDCAGSPASGCSVTMDRDHSVGVLFAAVDSSIRKFVARPPYHGSLSSQYFNCDSNGVDCSATVPDGAVRQIGAYPDDGYVFAGWGDDCSGQRDSVCSLRFDRDRTVSAIFKPVGSVAAGTN